MLFFSTYFINLTKVWKLFPGARMARSLIELYSFYWLLLYLCDGRHSIYLAPWLYSFSKGVFHAFMVPFPGYLHRCTLCNDGAGPIALQAYRSVEYGGVH